MSNQPDSSSWGTIISGVVGTLIAIVLLVWKMQDLENTQKARKAVEEHNRVHSEAFQKAQQKLREQREQGGTDIDLGYPPKIRDPRLASPSEDAMRQLAPGGVPINDGTRPYQGPLGSPATPTWGRGAGSTKPTPSYDFQFKR